MMKHIFSVDVEDWYHGFPPEYAVAKPHRARLEFGMRYLLDSLERSSVKATFFWLADQAERYPSLLRETLMCGHEIGCHGLNHTPLYRETPAGFRETTERALAIIEDISGGSVHCYRAPYFSLRADTLWSLDILASLGIRFDSSIFPMKHWRTGIPDAPDTIHQIETGSGPIIEVPVTSRRIFGRNIPTGGGGYFRAYPYILTQSNFAHCRSAGKPAVFYIHPWELDPDQPGNTSAGIAKAMHNLGLRSARTKLTKLLNDHSFGPMMEIAGALIGMDVPVTENGGMASAKIEETVLP